MKAIVVQYEHGYIYEESMITDEVWIFEEYVDIDELQRGWDQCKKKTKLHEYMNARNGVLVEFDILEK